MDLGLRNKVLVVGGGEGGIGKKVVSVLEAEGAIVLVADKREGGVVDLANPAQVAGFFEWVTTVHGRLDGYVSLVYGGGGESSVLTAIPREIEAEIRNTLLAAVYPAQMAARIMVKQGGGNIVIISSVNSVLGLDEFAYDVAKGGVNRIAPDVAQACGRYGVTAVTLCPGTVGGTPSWVNRDAKLSRVAASIPDRKVTMAEELGHVIAFFLTDHAKMFNGQTLIADRGWSLRPVFE